MHEPSLPELKLKSALLDAMVRLTKISGKIHYVCDSEKEQFKVEKSLTVKHDNPYFSPAYKLGKWDGLIRFYDGKARTFPFGMIETVVNDLEIVDIEYQIDGVFDNPFIPSLAFNENLYEHQLEALKMFFDFRHGIVKVSTRGGKTFIASEGIRLITHDIKDILVLFLVESEMLFEQAIDDISKYLKINKKLLGRIKGEVFDPKQITVAMVQTIDSILHFEARAKTRNVKLIEKSSEEDLGALNLKLKNAKAEKRKRKREFDSYMKSVKFLIVDECHEFNGENRIKILKKFDVDFALYLSATPFKSENRLGNLNLQSISGPVLYTIHEKVLKERGVLATDKILLFAFDHDNNKNIAVDKDSSYGDYQREVITHNERRNQILVNVVEICRKMKLKTLVLFIYKKHAYYINSITGDIFLSGDDKLEYRQSTKKAFLKKKGGVLFASNIFKKGLTLPEVEILINAGGGLEQSEVIQKKGRVLGVKGTKTKALIIDFIDSSKYFNEHSLSRIQVYEESVGIENIIVLDTEDGDFYRDIKEFLKGWFEI